ncbi:MAG TPA: peptidoglycan editing factor PgeF [Dissulfurispiraceae bacterium]|nr:peptidoglycan editing factor PgeF [Dissulfurispiraceae bacterium]
MPGLIIPPIFDGFPVKAYFTTKSSPVESSRITALLHANEVYFPVQKHTDTVIVADGGREPEIADAVVTDRKGLAVGVRVADCVPVLLYDAQKQIVAAVHAGWRGTAADILGKTVRFFSKRFGSLPEDILVAIGPSIKRSCYAVGSDVADAVAGAAATDSCITAVGRDIYADLPEANRLQAVNAGIAATNIWMSDECTHCLPDRFHSYRFSKTSAGRQSGIIVLD